jgi:hypothetical protein
MLNKDYYPFYLRSLKFNSKNRYLKFVKDSQVNVKMKKCAHLNFNEYKPEFRNEQYIGRMDHLHKNSTYNWGHYTGGLPIKLYDVRDKNYRV